MTAPVAATITTLRPGAAGVPIAYQAANGPSGATGAANDAIVSDGKTAIHVRNAGTGTATVTVTSLRQCDQGFTHNLAVAVGPTNGNEWIGPFATNRFSDANGLVQITYDQAASVTVAALAVT